MEEQAWHLALVLLQASTSELCQGAGCAVTAGGVGAAQGVCRGGCAGNQACLGKAGLIRVKDWQLTCRNDTD
eukprot:1159040-Pelagomonas_calceolata.AAC.11